MCLYEAKIGGGSMSLEHFFKTNWEEFFRENYTYNAGNERINVIRLDMNFSSLSLYMKNNFYNDPSLLFFVSLFQLFQSLPINSHQEGPPFYAYTQSLVVYYIRKLAQRGIVKIILKEKEDSFYLSDEFYYALGNKTSLNKRQMYNVLFVKLRDLEESDISFIVDLIRFLHIDVDRLNIKIVNGKLVARYRLSNFAKEIGALPEGCKNYVLSLKRRKNAKGLGKILS